MNTDIANHQKGDLPYDARGLLLCDCGELCAYRLLREGDRFCYMHRKHAGIIVLRYRRPGWRIGRKRGV